MNSSSMKWARAAALVLASTCLLGQANAVTCEVTNPQPRTLLYGRDPALAGLSASELVKRAEAGSVAAQNDLGVLYGTGAGGVARDSEASARWYLRAAESGLASAQANLAFMYFHGEGVQKDIDLAIQWAGRAAAQGHFQGQIFLGYMYGTGSGVKKDGKTAEACYLLAAKQGNLDAQRALSRMYERGEDIPRDTEKALLWLHRVRDGVLSGKTWREE